MLYAEKFTYLLNFLFGLVIFFICTVLGIIHFYPEVYKFVVVNKFQMTGWKSKRAKTKPDYMYKLQIYKFTKLYDTASNSGPKARSGHRIVCKEDALYSIGGYNPSEAEIIQTNDTLFHEIWRFDFVTKNWMKLEFENLPEELASCATILSGNLLFLYGGTGLPFGVQINRFVYICALQNALHSKLVFSPLTTQGQVLPVNQYGQSIAIVGSYLYTVGGTDGFRYSMDVFRLNMKTQEWEKLFDQNIHSNSPSPRYRHEIVHYDGYLYVFGGGTSARAYSLKEIPAFNLNTNKWEVFKTYGDPNSRQNSVTFPASRRCHSCVQDPYNKAIVFINGGYNGREKVYNSTWRLDLNTYRWKHMTSLDLPLGTYFHSASTTPDGRMIIFGGITNKDQIHERTADVYSAWITVPKLADACWDAFLYYLSNDIIQLPEDMRTLGLPLKYEARLKTSFSSIS